MGGNPGWNRVLEGSMDGGQRVGVSFGTIKGSSPNVVCERSSLSDIVPALRYNGAIRTLGSGESATVFDVGPHAQYITINRESLYHANAGVLIGGINWNVTNEWSGDIVLRLPMAIDVINKVFVLDIIGTQNAAAVTGAIKSNIYLASQEPRLIGSKLLAVEDSLFSTNAINLASESYQPPEYIESDTDDPHTIHYIALLATAKGYVILDMGHSNVVDA